MPKPRRPKSVKRRRRRPAQPKSAEVKKYVLLEQVHLGHCGDTFPAGSTVEYDPQDDFIYINGRPFDDSRDLDILLRHGQVVEYDEEVAETLQSRSRAAADKRRREVMPIVESDQDQMNVEIPIGHTQVGKRRMEQRDAERHRRRSGNAEQRRRQDMGVVRGDQSPEEYRARVLREQAEEAAQRADQADRRIRGMTVLQGDHAYGSSGKEPSRNLGATVGRRALEPGELDQIRDENRRKAAEGIDTRNEVRAKMNLEPIPAQKLHGRDSLSGISALDVEDLGDIPDSDSAEDIFEDDEYYDEVDGEYYEADDEEYYDLDEDEFDEFDGFDEEDDGVQRCPIQSQKDVAALLRKG